MKRFIIISLLSAMTLPMLACGWYGTDNYYLFSPYKSHNFRSRVDNICKDNWKAYLGSTEEYFWFNPEEVTKAARQKGDALMVSYIENLQKYLDCVDIEQRKQYEWNYPTKEDIDGQKRNLQAVRTYAFSKIKTKLRSQHALLYMRCNMMLGRHQDNITFWEQTATNFIETVYKDMMKNIYAGALYKSNRAAEAAELFAEMDDDESLMTMFYKKRSYLAISQHYKQNPTSKVLPWLMTDFVNNAQEAADAANDGGGGSIGKQFIRDINKQESWQMQQFCEMVVREGKTDCPIMWKMAKAWLEFLSGNTKDATKDIFDAIKLEGTDRMKDNARVIMLYITASQAKQGEAFDDYLADELEWLKEKGDEDFFFSNAENRLTNQVLLKHYANSPERHVAIAEACNSACSGFDKDTLRVDKLEKYLFYTNTPAKNKLDKFLKSHIYKNDTVLADLIGTKYMRLCQWDKAIQWLKDIPVSFYNEHHGPGYRYYSVLRSYEVEPWIKRQWLDESDIYEKDYKWWKHKKLDFCKEMQMMEGSLNLLKGKALDQRYYNLAVRYAQASIHGDCWWLLRYSKSCYDNFRVNEVNLDDKALEMLQKAAMTSDPALKRKALFAMGYRELYGMASYGQPNKKLWRYDEWDTDKQEYINKYNLSSPQYRAFQSLFDLTNDNPQEEFIRKCDEFDQFRNYYRKHKNQ
jgi:hypothetical protein